MVVWSCVLAKQRAGAMNHLELRQTCSIFFGEILTTRWTFAGWLRQEKGCGVNKFNKEEISTQEVKCLANTSRKSRTGKKDTIMKLFNLIVGVITFSPTSLDAYPFGAGGCTGGQAAVGPPHRFRSNVTTGILADAGITVLLDSKPLPAGGFVNFKAGRPHKIEIKAAKGKFFLGFLVRLAAGTSGIAPYDALAPYKGDSFVQYSIECSNGLVGGVTHTSNVKKTSIAANLTFATPYKGLPLDITVVVENDEKASAFYYNWFWLNAV